MLNSSFSPIVDSESPMIPKSMSCVCEAIACYYECKCTLQTQLELKLAYRAMATSTSPNSKSVCAYNTFRHLCCLSVAGVHSSCDLQSLFVCMMKHSSTAAPVPLVVSHAFSTQMAKLCSITPSSDPCCVSFMYLFMSLLQNKISRLNGHIVL